MSLASFVQIVARGKSRARPLTFDEAKSAMTLMLDPATPREATGALLMVLRMRGETPDEIAGFAAALATTAPLPTADLDWPCYAAGRTRGAPLFLLAAKLVAQAGYRVAIHGYNSHQTAAADVETALNTCKLLGDGLSYTPLSRLSPSALRLLKLRETLGLRSCNNTVLRVWNPSGASASVQGVFHPSYRSLQAKAGLIRGAKTLSIIKGGGGEFERHPSKSVETFGLRNGAHFQTLHAPIWGGIRRLHDPDTPVSASDLWFDQITDPFATATVIGTAALALWTLNAQPDMASAETYAAALWDARHTLIDRKSA